MSSAVFGGDVDGRLDGDAAIVEDITGVPSKTYSTATRPVGRAVALRLATELRLIPTSTTDRRHVRAPPEHLPPHAASCRRSRPSGDRTGDLRITSASRSSSGTVWSAVRACASRGLSGAWRRSTDRRGEWSPGRRGLRPTQRDLPRPGGLALTGIGLIIDRGHSRKSGPATGATRDRSRFVRAVRWRAVGRSGSPPRFRALSGWGHGRCTGRSATGETTAWSGLEAQRGLWLAGGWPRAAVKSGTPRWRKGGPRPNSRVPRLGVGESLFCWAPILFGGTGCGSGSGTCPRRTVGGIRGARRPG